MSPVYDNVDPSSILVRWAKENEMSCKTDKCEELIVINVILSGIPQCASLLLLGLTLQSDFKYGLHVRVN